MHFWYSHPWILTGLPAVVKSQWNARVTFFLWYRPYAHNASPFNVAQISNPSTGSELALSEACPELAEWVEGLPQNDSDGGWWAG